MVATYPHDPGAFTQGLEYVDGRFYEGTGLNGQSSIRMVTPATGVVVKKQPLDYLYFGEGITVFDGKLFEIDLAERNRVRLRRKDLSANSGISLLGRGLGTDA